MDYGARWYSPGSGRFTQPDPIVPNPYNPQSLNRYTYTYSNPINFIDPSGNTAICADGDQCQGTGLVKHTTYSSTQSLYSYTWTPYEGDNAPSIWPTSSNDSKDPVEENVEDETVTNSSTLCDKYPDHAECQGEDANRRQYNFGTFGVDFDISAFASGFSSGAGTYVGPGVELHVLNPSSTYLNGLDAALWLATWIKAASIDAGDIPPNLYIETNYAITESAFGGQGNVVYIRDIKIHNFSGAEFVFVATISSFGGELSFNPTYTGDSTLVHVEREFSMPVMVNIFAHNQFTSNTSYTVPSISP